MSDKRPGLQKYEYAQRVRKYAKISDKDQPFVDKVDALIEQTLEVRHADGSYPSVETPLPNELAPSYLHPKRDKDKTGKFCLCCETQKRAEKFSAARHRQDQRNDICMACMTRYFELTMPFKAQKAHKDEVNEQARQKQEQKQEQIGVKEAVLRELAQRKLAKQHLLPFIMRFHDKYEPGWVHKAICKRLEKFSKDVAAKRSPRLMIFMPPRSGKSEIASKNFPAWHLGRYPDHEIIASSYAVSLPLGFSRKVRELINTESYRQVFGKTWLSKTAQAAEAWLTTQGGGYVAAGVGTGITGKGAHIAIIDDPVKDAEEADSETQRQKVWDWYSSTLYTRLAPGGGILLINTRWHDDDLSGRVIRRQKEREKALNEEIEQLTEELEAATDDTRTAIEEDLAKLHEELENMERWDILVFPQEATHDEYYQPQKDSFHDEPVIGSVKIRSKGDPLHPQRFDRRSIIRMKQTMEPRHWSALHQQNPVPEEGEIFTKSMFRYEPLVHDWRLSDVYIAGDLALGVKQSNDWSVLLAGAMDYDGLLHIIDMSRFKGGAVPIEENLIALLKRYERRLALFGLEHGQIQMALWPALLKRIKDEKIAVPFAEGKRALKPVSDKVARARTAQGMMQQGRIIFPSNQPWVEDVKIELLRFPGGLHDDIVDALAWLARMVVKVEPPKRPKIKGFKSWKDKLSGYTRDGKGNGHLSA